MAYATVDDVQARTTQTYTDAEKSVIATLLDDAAAIIDAYRATATEDAKKVVSCRMVIRAVAAGGDYIPTGATQGSIAAGGYSQSWTTGQGTVGELYLTKADRSMLGGSNQIGSRSPVEYLAPPLLMPTCLGVGHYD